MKELWKLYITPKANNPKVRNFFIRTLVTAFLLPVTFLVIWTGGWWLTVLITICGVLGGWELANLIANHNYRPVKFICSIWSGGLIVAVHFYLNDSGFIITVIPVMLSIPVALLVFIFFDMGFKNESLAHKVIHMSNSLVVNSLIPLIVGGLLSFALFLNNLQGGRDWIYTIVVVVAATDVSSYIFGSLFGKHKLVPKISPSKTWEGGLAGLTFAIVTSVCLYYLFDLRGNLGLLIGFGGLLYFSALVGDLLESTVKRMVGVKDSGSLIPGHGGILDRMDSILISLFAGYLFVLWTID